MKNLINQVRQFLKGAKLKKFEAAIAVLTESMEAGSWAPRGDQKVSAGFYQGLVYCRYNKSYEVKGAAAQAEDDALDLARTLSYGSPFAGNFAAAMKLIRAKAEKPIKFTDEQIGAWAALCTEVAEARAVLCEARPRPVITKIGLSPKVTKTLTEMNLDLDLPSIKLAKIESYTVMEPKRDREGNVIKPRIMEKVRYSRVVWTPGILHGQSRFDRGCHACGKHIPSGMFVPVEAHDKRTDKLVSLWLGCDCARNIFGVKDIGVERDAK